MALLRARPGCTAPECDRELHQLMSIRRCLASGPTFDDKKGQRTGIAGKYTENTLRN